jgi:hypothetical protein
MSDNREAILARMLVILTAIKDASPSPVVPITTVARNLVGLPAEDKLPALILLDGDERLGNLRGQFIRMPRNGRGGAINAPATPIRTMSPQIFYIPEKPSQKQHVNVGPRAALIRNAVQKAISEDAVLAGLLSSHGEISPVTSTDLKEGSLVQGRVRVDVQLTYLYRP